MESGYVDGRHYTEWADTVKSLKRDGRADEAESLLLRLVQATEDESSANGWGVAPWYYEQIAIIRSKRGDFAGEVEILRRYCSRPSSPGVSPPRLGERLRAAEAKLDSKRRIT